MHLISYWRHADIVTKPMNHLTLTDVHLDDRFVWKTLPSMQQQGLRYPLVCFTATEEFYWTKFWKACPAFMKERLPKPSIVDGIIYMIKGGNNRYQSANSMGCSKIDCLIFAEQIDAIKWTRYLDQCDPVDNPNLPYLGLIEYK